MSVRSKLASLDFSRTKPHLVLIYGRFLCRRILFQDTTAVQRKFGLGEQDDAGATVTAGAANALALEALVALGVPSSLRNIGTAMSGKAGKVERRRALLAIGQRPGCFEVAKDPSLGLDIDEKSCRGSRSHDTTSEFA
jgi:hypothetical protein